MSGRAWTLLCLATLVATWGRPAGSISHAARPVTAAWRGTGVRGTGDAIRSGRGHGDRRIHAAVLADRCQSGIQRLDRPYPRPADEERFSINRQHLRTVHPCRRVPERAGGLGLPDRHGLDRGRSRPCAFARTGSRIAGDQLIFDEPWERRPASPGGRRRRRERGRLCRQGRQGSRRPWRRSHRTPVAAGRALARRGRSRLHGDCRVHPPLGSGSNVGRAARRPAMGGHSVRRQIEFVRFQSQLACGIAVASGACPEPRWGRSRGNRGPLVCGSQPYARG